MIESAAQLFAALVAFTALFQWLLGAGAPWGEITMGGKFPGKLPAKVRVAAVVQSFILIALAMLVLAHAGVALPGLVEHSQIGVWVAVGVSGLAMILNLATPSKWERLIWGPVTILMFVSAMVVAIK